MANRASRGSANPSGSEYAPSSNGSDTELQANLIDRIERLEDHNRQIRDDCAKKCAKKDAEYEKMSDAYTKLLFQGRKDRQAALKAQGEMKRLKSKFLKTQNENVEMRKEATKLKDENRRLKLQNEAKDLQIDCLEARIDDLEFTVVFDPEDEPEDEGI